MAGVLKIEAASSRVGMLMPPSTKVALSCMRIHGFLGRNHRYDMGIYLGPWLMPYIMLAQARAP